MLDLDVERFWKDDEIAHRENCFYEGAPQMAMGIRMENGCVFQELGESGDEWGYTPVTRRIELNKRYNEKAVKLVGRPLLAEDFLPEDASFPEFRNIGEVFGGRYDFDGTTVWLEQGMSTPEELEKRLDFVDRMDLREFVLPTNWESEKKRIYETYGRKPSLFRGVRGPVTLACSVFGAENFIFLCEDEPDLARRFSRTITDVIGKYIDLFDEEAGYAPGEAPHGFSFMDDDCCLLTPEMYEMFAYPILRDVFARQSPNPEDWRYQHSDSAMAHQLPFLGRLNLTACNFGPTVSITEIRKYMPHTKIQGVLAPFTFMNNDEKGILEQLKRDYEQVLASGVKGVEFATAGSVNGGSSLASFRFIMAAIQNLARY